MELQIKTEEAAKIAGVVLQIRAGRRLDDATRETVAAKLRGLALSTLRVFPGSLEQDPDMKSNFYLAVDGAAGGSWSPLLLQIAPLPDVSRDYFANPVAVERAVVAGQKVVLNFFSFSTYDRLDIRTFTSSINSQFLPRPQGALPAIAAGNRHPEISLPAAFDAYRTILEKRRVNMASTVQLSATREMTTEEALAARDGENPVATGHTRVSIRHLYDAGLWAAIRAGWRDGYTAEADHFIVSGNTPEEIARSIEPVRAPGGFPPSESLERFRNRPEVPAVARRRRAALGSRGIFQAVQNRRRFLQVRRGGNQASGRQVWPQPEAERGALRLHRPVQDGLRRQP
jgi:hypothetical protein